MIVPDLPSPPTLTLRPLALLGLAGGALVAAVLLSNRRDAANEDEERQRPPKYLGWITALRPRVLNAREKRGDSPRR